jgi:hypothetical protein
MTRSILLVAAGILASALFACALPPTAPPPAPTPVTVATCDTSNPIQFLNRLYILNNNYDPDPNHPGKTLPTGTQPVGEPYCSSLTNLYNSAAPPFKNALDNLTATFIDARSCGGTAAACSWGFKDKYTKGTGNTYVALSSSLWSGGLVPYSQFANSIVSALLPSAPSTVLSIQANLDTPAMALIAGLAHEIGHTKWWENDIEHYKCPNDPVTGTRTLFADITWSHHSNAPLWRYFGKESSGNKPMGNVDKDVILADLGSPANELADLNTIYNGRWASIFSTVSPDEDYVETYTLIALIQAMQYQSGSAYLKVTPLPNINNTSIDLVALYGRPSAYYPHDLYHKVQWILNCGM